MIFTNNIQKTHESRALCYYYTIYCKRNCRTVCVSPIFGTSWYQTSNDFL